MGPSASPMVPEELKVATARSFTAPPACLANPAAEG